MSRLHAGALAALMTLAPCALAAPARPLALPAPGTYKLERILKAPDGVVLDSDGSRHRLSEFTTGKVTLFSFIYTYCTDSRGCPLAYATLHTLKKTLGKDARTRDRVRFVSMSFDPTYDTPPAMRSYGGEDARDRGSVEWRFLTSGSNAELAPLLDGFGQDVSVASERAPGQRLPTLSHLLKVYLIDASGSVREIYSTSFLQPDVVLNDIRSLLLERAPKR
ncbi:SCO family protein [Massilia pseudoviolaceinigra]|uniref:SCO family protein n=1 Tax=Massilia pseudoviolaceinigra TaxID=3057165 RepID=UPI0027966427|nr:SCO family protein [Massilia sp. CCM 9206]MDQ1924038.1 SCO family protein [Massilia sp. CCM 9206]